MTSDEVQSVATWVTAMVVRAGRAGFGYGIACGVAVGAVQSAIVGPIGGPIVGTSASIAVYWYTYLFVVRRPQ